MKELIQGLKRFNESVYPEKKPLFNELSKGQKPHTLLITCSDSRIDPNLVTQTAPGDIFVIRNAGNIVPQYGKSHGGEEPTIEYAIEGLKVKNIVVCGHSQCGAMSALLNKDSLEKLPAVNKWLSHADITLERLGGSKDLAHAVQTNAVAQVDNLKSHPSVAAALERNEVNLFACVYSFESGQVHLYEPKTKSFVLTLELDPNTDFSEYAL